MIDPTAVKQRWPHLTSPSINIALSFNACPLPCSFPSPPSTKQEEVSRISSMAKMRRVCRRLMFQVVPCTSKSTLRTESRKDIEEILKEKLSTIVEEPEFYDEIMASPMRPRLLFVIKKGRKKFRPKVKRLRELFFLPQFNIRDSYGLFITGFASKGTFGGLLQ